MFYEIKKIRIVRYKDYFMLDADYRPMKKSYSSDGIWGTLNLLDFSDGIRINSNYYNDMMLYVYAYALLSAWDNTETNYIEVDNTNIIDYK